MRFCQKHQRSFYETEIDCPLCERDRYREALEQIAKYSPAGGLRQIAIDALEGR